MSNKVNKVIEWKSKKMISVLSDYDFRREDLNGSEEYYTSDESEVELIIDHSPNGGAILISSLTTVHYFAPWNDELATFYDTSLKG
jgi:hypothetical protein